MLWNFIMAMCVGVFDRYYIWTPHAYKNGEKLPMRMQVCEGLESRVLGLRQLILFFYARTLRRL